MNFRVTGGSRLNLAQLLGIMGRYLHPKEKLRLYLTSSGLMGGLLTRLRKLRAFLSSGEAYPGKWLSLL